MSVSVADRPRKSQWRAVSLAEASDQIEKVVGNYLCDLQSVNTVNAETLQPGNILHKNVYAERPHPSFRASIKDGYAVIANDGAGKRCVIGTSCAKKDAPQITITAGACCRINTGAALPDGADAVVQIENTVLVERNYAGNEEAIIEILKAPRVGQDIREVGSDVALGDLLLKSGLAIGAAEIALLHLNNVSQIATYEPARVCVMSTGDELVDAFGSEPTGSNAVIDTNRPMLKALFRDKNFNVTDLEKFYEAIVSGLEYSDVLVTSGGVSMGEKDYLKSILADRVDFTIHFGRVFMKPGLPTTFASGLLNGRPKLVFALPGNPVSAFVTAQLYVVPVLRRISGFVDYNNTKLIVECAEEITLDIRPEYRRAFFKLDSTMLIVERGSNGAPLVELVSGSQISSRILSASSANVLLELPACDDTLTHLSAGSPLVALVIGSL